MAERHDDDPAPDGKAAPPRAYAEDVVAVENRAFAKARNALHVAPTATAAAGAPSPSPLPTAAGAPAPSPPIVAGAPAAGTVIELRIPREAFTDFERPPPAVPRAAPDPSQINPPGYPDAQALTDPQRYPIGLALSGGGIRSATFSLGVLQAFAAAQRLRVFDVMSTVSGGGYIGGWLTAWIARKGLTAVEDKLGRLGSDDSTQNSTPRNAEPPEVTRLRQFSNYLAPRPRLLSLDVLTLVATWFRNVFLNLLVMGALFAALLTLPRLLLPGVTTANVEALHLDVVASVLGAVFFCGFAVQLYAQNPVSRAAIEGRRFIRLLLPYPVVVGSALLAGLALALWAFQQHATIRDEIVIGLALPLIAAGFFTLRLERIVEVHEAVTGQSRRTGVARGLLGWVNMAFVFIVAGFAGVATTVLLLDGLREWLVERVGLRAGRFHQDATFLWSLDTLTFAPGLVLLTFAVSGSVFVGLVGRAYYERSREWWSRLNAFLAACGVGLLAWGGLVFYAPALMDWLFALADGWIGNMAALGWLASAVMTLLGPRAQPRTELRRQWLHRALGAATIVFAAGLLLLAAWGVQGILNHYADVAPEVPVLAVPPPDVDITITLPSGADAGAGATATVLQAAPNVATARGTLRPNTSPPLTGFDAFVAARLAETWGLLEGTHEFPYQAWVAFVGFLALFVLFGLRVDVNRFSLHNLYKLRLIRCYLGASHDDREPNPFTGFDDRDDIALADLAIVNVDGTARPTRPEGEVAGESPYHIHRPYHLINAACNLTAGRELAWQERQAANFVLSPLYCGHGLVESDAAQTTGVAWRPVGGPRPPPATATPPTPQPLPEGYVHTSLFGGTPHTDGTIDEDQQMTLGIAMATSGAAVSPASGRLTQPSLAFLLTLFNARLGRWSPNPSHAIPDRISPRFGPWWLFRELFGRTDARAAYVYLSDGGHFENLALYELVRRRCRLIVCVDAAADPRRTFGDLGEAVRKCRIDFGAEIIVDTSALVPDDKGWTQAGCAAGWVVYPPAAPGEPAEFGRLLYVKPSLYGAADMPSDLRAYAKAEAQFPHQTTADQFFSESQFESYRRLGVKQAQDLLDRFPALL
jgi:hypothetical protein